MMGASAQECSAFSPMVPFLKTIRLKDLSNHLQRNHGLSVCPWLNRNQICTLRLPTCRSTFHEADTWHNCSETQRGCWYHSAALCHPGLRRRLPSQWHPETACSYHGWSKCHEHWPMGSCGTNQISKRRKSLGQECFLTMKLFHPHLNSSDCMLAL